MKNINEISKSVLDVILFFSGFNPITCQSHSHFCAVKCLFITRLLMLTVSMVLLIEVEVDNERRHEFESLSFLTQTDAERDAISTDSSCRDIQINKRLTVHSNTR